MTFSNSTFYLWDRPTCELIPPLGQQQRRVNGDLWLALDSSQSERKEWVTGKSLSLSALTWYFTWLSSDPASHYLSNTIYNWGSLCLVSSSSQGVLLCLASLRQRQGAMAVANFQYITRMSSGFKVYILEGKLSFIAPCCLVNTCITLISGIRSLLWLCYNTLVLYIYMLRSYVMSQPYIIPVSITVAFTFVLCMIFMYRVKWRKKPKCDDSHMEHMH